MLEPVTESSNEQQKDKRVEILCYIGYIYFTGTRSDCLQLFWGVQLQNIVLYRIEYLLFP
jgi:hypothetical protein